MSMQWLRHESQVPSTNDVVLDWIRNGCEHGVALYADEQTAGRGRSGRTWHSGPGKALYLSIAIVDPAVRRHLELLPLIAGVVCVDALADSGVDIGLKWPNDLLVGGRKLGGILCEGATSGSALVGAVVGIGINLEQPEDEFPEELQDIATSLRIAGAVERPSAEALAQRIRRGLVEELDVVAAKGPSGVLDRFRALDVTVGRGVQTADGRTGVACGISADGALLVDSDGERIAVRSGEITWS